MNSMTHDLHDDSRVVESSYISAFQQKNQYEQQINQAWRRSEPECVSDLMAQHALPEELNHKIYQLAFDLSHSLRERKSDAGKAGIVQGLLQEFSLSSQEGIALMCLAEALLRIPDHATRDELIRDKINQGNWKAHLGNSQLMFVNAAAWGLMLTGKLMQTPEQSTLSGMLTRLIERSGRGIIRKAVDVAMRMMGEQFVTGETIEKAIKHAEVLEADGFRYSYDMLGEAAVTEADAERYFKDYENAIHAIGKASGTRDVYQGPGISIKLSALHPRYQRAQIERVHGELYPKILELAVLAKHYNIGLNIDAEESERLELSLALLEQLCFEPQLDKFTGIGFVIQAYQKRCTAVVDYLIDLATRSEKRLMIRLVKGAYWDSEIKKAQIDGMSDYPVFSRKVHTDLSYLVCAEKLLAAPEQIYPQFATHNAQTLATIYHLAKPAEYYPGQYEFQCLHGMGESLYTQVVGDTQQNKLGVPCRIYAPVGKHETLLAYLVRRLLENGANSSFVNRIADKSLDIDALIQSPQQQILDAAEQEQQLGLPHRKIPQPLDLYLPYRRNSIGFDLNNDQCLAQLDQQAQQLRTHQWQAQPMGEGLQQLAPAAAMSILNPANHQDQVGTVYPAQAQHIEQALKNATQAQAQWAKQDKHLRAVCLNRAAALMEERMTELLILLCRESGKTYANGISEVREAVDFLRYYAAQIIDLETSTEIEALGPVLCISPWNFPLAIFSGQVAAALVAGNTVLAKPAEQTPLVAALAIELLWQAGVPRDVVQLLPGDGATVGAALSADSRVQGVMFTGSTEVAKILQRGLAQRRGRTGQPIPLIAETGGQNAMIVDSSALTEQVVLDIVSSAFDSAGQRCSALRILYVQKDAADVVINMLKGAMQQLQLGQPWQLSTDVGPVIDQEAQATIQAHIQRMASKGYAVHQLTHTSEHGDQTEHGTFVRPTLIQLPHLDDLEREVFGPVLHVLSYAQGQLPALLDAINAKGYGLTMGLHTRIDAHIAMVTQQAQVGNLYINRNIVGAVVGVQPFGGEGLSGTGPKAGGPLYLYRLMQSCSQKRLDPPFAVQAAVTSAAATTPYSALQHWLDQQQRPPHKASVAVGQSFELQGPTGERNLYQLLPRERVLCTASSERDLILQLQTVLSIGSQAVISQQDPIALALYQRLPTAAQQQLAYVDQVTKGEFDAVLHQGDQDSLLQLQQQIAERQGAIIGITHIQPGAEQIAVEGLLFERALSVNTAAAGGNASLMTIG